MRMALSADRWNSPHTQGGGPTSEGRGQYVVARKDKMHESGQGRDRLHEVLFLS